MPKTTLETVQYELTFIMGEKTNNDDAKKKVADVTKHIEKLGGKVSKEEPWGRRELAYPIKRNRTGFYTTLWFELPGSGVKALEQELRFDEGIIRSLVTKAYTSAQPGNLYPVVEEKVEKTEKAPKEETATPEEMLRRSSTKTAKKEEPKDETEDIPEEERLKKLDEALEGLLDKDETAE